jgi:DnaK suppressor protein
MESVGSGNESVSGDNGSGLAPHELDVLRERLERTRAELQARLEREESFAAEVERLTEPMDAAEQTREQEDVAALAERDRRLLREVDRALGKLDDGSYGLSEASGEPIGFRRLEAIPWARVTADEAEPG